MLRLYEELFGLLVLLAVFVMVYLRSTGKSLADFFRELKGGFSG